MSEQRNAHDDHDSPHEGPIKTPKQLIVAVVFSFLIPIVVILLLVTFVVADKRAGAGSDAFSEESVARRIQPVGTVELKDLSNPATLKSGEDVFKAQCSACHTTGAAGAPKLGDAAAWSDRLPKGYDTLLQSALKGKGAMGPQGGGDFSDLEIGRAVVYMANGSGGKFEEPKAPAAAPTAEAAPTTATTATGSTPQDNQAAQNAAAAVAAANMGTQAAASAPVTSAAAAPAAAAAVPALYAQACQVCHGAGVAGAPKVGDKAGWAPRLAQGLDALTASAIKGKGAMPPKGGAMSASDADIKEVVTYMVNASK
ncbi:c-type cytochrome [Caldimonas brevitalea]|uniref:Cytochrome C n=1 Tax=Caldimonas brevitalea TaxID=413882 RepID=A0A0G3BRL9_9BURK|nr:c-type cytochrome [Caldimonas brevitalea]AKJ32062.1 cytochrome C [Caldimonas brevitalea]